MLEIVSIGMLEAQSVISYLFQVFSLFRTRSFHFHIFVWGWERRFNPIESIALEIVDELVYFFS